ncbi:aldo/keto reductase [Larkinella rosea]|uniref:Aldo/keto reductase n=1 Tax=Larkinella rosea TaxID=2025312 RepID=A0A3P1C0F0_9BACT|nr:aldo/keto reductase [Larkinella rosea]RRB06606.1 aldo/keto reductase [Larkinella rosea]
MEYRKLGESDLTVSAIAFGAWAVGGWMWGGTERKDAVEAIKASFDLGVTTIDTAPVYGQGTSEEIVGEAIRGIPRDQVQILTKYGMRWNLAKGTLAFHTRDNHGTPIDVYKFASKESIIKECEDSLERLGTDYIDLYQIHWPDVTTPISETMEAVSRLIEQGKVREAGVSNYNVEQMKEAERTLKLVSNQVSYSMVKRDIEAELVPYCLETNKSIVAYSPLERGLLAGKIRPGHQFAEGDHRVNYKAFKDGNIDRVWPMLDQLNALADQKQVTMSQLVIRWTIDRPAITVALVGARNAEQAVQNAKAMDVTLTADETAYINQLLETVTLV